LTLTACCSKISINHILNKGESKMKKFLMLFMVFLFALTIVACGGDDDPVDEENPVISGTRDFTYIIGESTAPNYTQGVTAIDNLDGTITSQIVVNSSAVNLQVPGVYNVVYTVTDLAGNVGTITRTVTVLDTTAPVITGVAGLSYVIGDPAPNYLTGVSATDNVDGDITADIVVNSSAVNLTVVGVYAITYTVEDSSENETVVNSFIQVKLHADDADLVPPVIAGTMNYTFTIGVTQTINFATGVTASDNVDGDVTDSIEVDSSAVNFTTPGTYNVVYTAEDSYGNVATVTVTVTVVLETEKPVIGGVRILEYYIGDPAPDYRLGLTVSDNVSELETADIVVDSSEVVLTVAGRYPVYFTVTDEAGNVGEAETEIIVAVNPISLVPDLNATYRTYTSPASNLNPYSETLATASDLFAWLTDSLYVGDYDWAAAKQILVDEGVEDLPAEIGFEEWYEAGKSAADLPYNRFPRMAATEPEALDEEGLQWKITLRDDLMFQDGTPINAATFDYSWRQLLDPKLLNDRASNLYDPAYLPLVGAEAYFKQEGNKSDSLGYPIYTVGEVEYRRENSFFGSVIGYPTWLLYYIEQPYNTLVGPEYTSGDVTLPAGQKAYVEYWGASYGAKGGYVIVDQLDNPFYFDENGGLIAPYEGWTLNGVAVPTDGTPDVYASAYPAYMDEDQNIATVDAAGFPVNGVATKNDPVAWSEVGFELVDGEPLSFIITLTEGRTAWDVMGNLTSGITGVVHEQAFEAGMNAGRTQTTYGTIDNPLVSYGPYNLTAWETDVLYFYTLNPEHYAASDYRITKVRYDVIIDQSIAVSEFKEGRLDLVGAGGNYYNEFKYNKNMKLTPTSTFFRFAFNIEGSEAYELNPILVYPEFRQAFYFAIDRETFASEVRAPSLASHGFLGPLYLSTEYNFVSYRSSVPGMEVLEDFSPESSGFDPVIAKQLFDEAYAKAVLVGDIQEGEKVSVEYKFYDVETNRQVAAWVKATVETIFNTGETSPIFELELAAVSSDALDQAWDNGDFEMTFGGWQGLTFDAPSMLGQVYNSSLAYMLEKGFDTASAEVSVSLPNSKAAVTGWVAEFETRFEDYLALRDAYLAIEEPTEQQTTDYNASVDALPDADVPSSTQLTGYTRRVAFLTNFEGDVLTTTYNMLYTYAYRELYNVADINYDGKDDDFDAITAALEAVLLDQMIAIPLFTTVGSTVYSTRVVFEANAYHAWMGWGGFKYMYLGKAA
jgi:oligopeptide transport system substrate-binding protein